MNPHDSLELLTRTLAEGAVIAFVLCVLRLLAALRFAQMSDVKSTAVFALVFPTIVPYGGKLLELLWQGSNGDTALQGYSVSWLMIAMQGRMAGAAIGVAACLTLVMRLQRNAMRR